MEPFDTVIEATEAAIAAAKHLTDMDSGAVAVLRDLARTVDAIADGDRAAEVDGNGKPRPLDNVTIPTYLKFCESLGLTPAGRLRLGARKEEPRGKLAQLRSVNGGKSAKRTG